MTCKWGQVWTTLWRLPWPQPQTSTSGFLCVKLCLTLMNGLPALSGQREVLTIAIASCRALKPWPCHLWSCLFLPPPEAKQREGTVGVQSQMTVPQSQRTAGHITKLLSFQRQGHHFTWLFCLTCLVSPVSLRLPARSVPLGIRKMMSCEA